jgi:hypothetical protein
MPLSTRSHCTAVVEPGSCVDVTCEGGEVPEKFPTTSISHGPTSFAENSPVARDLANPWRGKPWRGGRHPNGFRTRVAAMKEGSAGPE